MDLGASLSSPPVSSHKLRVSFFKDGPFLASFSLFSYFLYNVKLVDKILPMLGFYLQMSDVQSNRSTN